MVTDNVADRFLDSWTAFPFIAVARTEERREKDTGARGQPPIVFECDLD